MKGDVRLYSMSIIGQKPLTLLARSTDDRHQDQIPGKNFCL